MTPPITADDFLTLVERSGLLPASVLQPYAQTARRGSVNDATAGAVARLLQADRLLTHFQARKLLKGRFRGFYLSSKYKILDELGAGGMGRVFLCEHLILQKLVAVKLMSLSVESFPGASERFIREARAAAALDHRNIVRVYDVDRVSAGPYMVMEYVNGADLQNIVSKHGALSIERAAHYVAQAALGLEQAHLAGLVHRDIKPGNLLLDRTGTIKLLDLGLAMFFEAGKNENLTQRFDDNSIIGTADYIAPEQAVNSSRVDIRADIYSLGCTFYFLLTRQLPFGGGTVVEKLLSHQNKEPTPIRELRAEVPGDMARVLHKMLAKQPEKRFQTPAEVSAALARWTAKPIAAPSAGEMEQINPSSYRLGLSAQIPREAENTMISTNTSRPSEAEINTIRNHPLTDVRLANDTSSFTLTAPQSGPAENGPKSPHPHSEILGSSGVRSLLKGRLTGWPRIAVWGAISFGLVAMVGVAAALWNSNTRPPAVTASISREGNQNSGLGGASLSGAVPITLRGGGSTFVKPAMEYWAQLYEQQTGVKIEYTSVGSSKGIDGVLSKFLDFACSDAYLTDEQVADAGGAMVHIPLVMGAVVPTYNLADESGKHVELRFTGPLLADIFLGRTTKWNDGAILVSNPGKTLPDLPIQVVHRKDGSGTTFIWTDYLSKASSEWKKSVGVGNKVNWPIGIEADKNDGVADTVSRTRGAIGYVELSFALANGLPIGQVKNRDGRFIEPSMEGVTAAAAASLKSIPRDLRYLITDAPGAASYPISGTAWAVLSVEQPVEKREPLIKFLRWATHQGQPFVRDLRYATLPQDLVDRIDEVLDALPSGRIR